VSLRPGLLAILVLAGCTRSLGTLGMVGADPDPTDVKLIRPGVLGRSCRVSWLGFARDGASPDVREAIGQIRALDAEGNVVTNVQVVSRDLVTGVYNRRCIEVRGDLARTVTTVVLPAPPGHHGHH